MTTDIRTAKNATECYDARCTEVQDLLKDIQMLTGKLDRRDDPHWGHAGDLHRITEPLTEMRELLISMTRDL